MKKLILKKNGINEPSGRIDYKINYESELNTAQYEAVMHGTGAALVIAGAGTGKTRTLVYRVARLIEDRVPPDSILLLTFTRKSASEMLRRASTMLDGRCEKVSGGTFHSFALLILRQYSKLIGYEPAFNVLDQSDSEDTINLIRTRLKLDKSKRRFPQKSTLNKIFSLSINKRIELKDLLEQNFQQFLEDYDAIETVFMEFDSYKRKHGLMDYDDLLLNLLELLKNNPQIRETVNIKYKYVMVDEYQDTNRLQHEIVLQLGGRSESIMAVGDDAQSIYSFRGADFQNIMFFPESFGSCKVFKIEENYRSTQPILNLTNEIIDRAVFKYKKELFTRRLGGELPKIITAKNERQQSEFVVQQILEYREQGIALEDIAVLFRSSFLSFDLEIELNKSNVPYRKFGGMKFIETAHIKDLISFMKIIFNPLDAVSWHRALLLIEGIGPRTTEKIIELIGLGNVSLDNYSELSQFKNREESLLLLFKMLREIRNDNLSIGDKAATASEYYLPLLKKRYDDWQKRQRDIEMFLTITERYTGLQEFFNEVALDPPVDSLAELEKESGEEEFLTLSTIHSAKGLEWKVVFLIWALEGRFPSARAGEDIDSLEEERRLFYVACTRAKDDLFISYPTNIYDRETGYVLSEPSRF
ncbi:MAG: ATP-dependent helicase UvrD/PcrA, partial [Bacteroidota bacterium]|nr:ATP-dependent helicase UvrD/PcrA [Bacteroidota bacterium]